MSFRNFGSLALVSLVGIGCVARFLVAQGAANTPTAHEATFRQKVQPFLKKNCLQCHNTETAMAGVRADQLDATFDDRQVRVWEAMRKRISEQTMPPKGLPQPDSAERQMMVDWITQGIEIARLRPAPKNGLVRRLTVAQYRNTLRELLKLDDDLTNGLPPDAVSKDGFVNNQETLNLSPLLLESYFEIADEALNRAIIDQKSKPWIQDFKVELGASVNPNPIKETLILGAGSTLLDNKDVLVTQPVPVKPFAFDPRPMRTKYRFIEGYQGNDTVRGWREYDSIYHAVFADMRGSSGYPKGKAYGTVPEGLVLRPAIPNDELFEGDGTYGPKANFKISVRELPNDGRFRITVMAAKYNDGLLLDSNDPAQTGGAVDAVVVRNPKTPQTVTIAKAGVYQVDMYSPDKARTLAAPDSSRLTEGLTGSWPLNGDLTGGARLEGTAKFADSPFGKAVSLADDGSSAMIPRDESMNVGEGDFTVTAWINPGQFRKAGIVSLGGAGKHGWALETTDNRGVLRLETSGPDDKLNGSLASPRGTMRSGSWQHVAAVVRRGKKNDSWLYVNGYPVAKGEIGAANLDNLKANLQIGQVGGQSFKGEIDEVRLYRRALGEAELQALVEPGRQFVKAPEPDKTQDVTLALGSRQFSGALQQPAFLAVRLPAGPLPLDAQNTGMEDLERLVLTPVPDGHAIAKRFLTFEKRTPRLGVHMGFRRDCGSTFAPVGGPRNVADEKLSRFVFEGTIRNYPNPEVEKDNVNYLAGVREIAVRSEYTDGRDMPRLVVRSVEFEGPFYDSWPPPSYSNILPATTGGETPAYAREVIRSFATRAYRRPASPVEVNALMAVYQKASGGGLGFQASVKEALQVVLTSPQFLFLIENSHTTQAEPLDNYELASKLSYFLWNGPPDRTTLRLAANGLLRKQLDAEVARMVEDPKFSRFTREFTSQWLALDKFTVLEPDKKKFPKLTRDTRTQLRDEPIQFVEYLMRGNLPVRNLITSDFILANETVAGYYGLGDKTESGFGFMPLAHGRRELGGVLTQAPIMAGLSDGRESNPVKRGAWVARRIVAEPPADPPPNVPALKEDTAKTLRQRLEQHRNQPGCFQCHTKIDPWGVALEEFDAGGRLKEGPTDARSTLPDKTEVSGVNELRKYLAQDRIDQVAFSVLKHLATYGTGRSLTYSELDFLKRDSVRLKADDYRMKDLIRYVVNSKSFLEK